MKGTLGKVSPQKAKQDADEIKRDQEYVDRAISPEGNSMERGLGPTLAAQRLRKDSDEGRYAAAGFGDLGQFAGGDGSGGGAKPYMDDELTSGRAAYKRGGKVKKMASGGMTSSASKRADGIATKGKTRCKIC